MRYTIKWIYTSLLLFAEEGRLFTNAYTLTYPEIRKEMISLLSRIRSQGYSRN